VIVDGVTDIPRLPGQSAWGWSGTPPDRTFLDVYSVYHDVDGDDLSATARLTGQNWQIKYFRIAGEDHHTTITDLDDGADRRIETLVLGRNSDVDLISTRVDNVVGWGGGKHDVQLGSGYTISVQLDADVNILKTSSGDIGSIKTHGKSTIEIGDVHVGTVQTGSGNDKVTTGTEWVSYIGTGSGNDTVTMGSGGGLVWLGSGNDKIRVREMSQDGGVSVNGSGGTDTLDFARFNSSVTFDLGVSGW
jgi:serralysin